MITKDILEDAIKKCYSIYGLAKQLNVPTNGEYSKKLKAKIQEFGIDISHFLGRKTSGFLKNNPNKLHFSEVLVERRNGNQRELVRILRNAMIEYGMEFKCSKCNLNAIWNNEPIRLEIHHIDENPLNNRIENLTFLCPNCHSQETDRNTQKNKQTRNLNKEDKNITGKTICSICGSKTRNKQFCSNKCSAIAPKGFLKTIKKEELEKLVWSKPCTEIAKDLGVSNASITYYCRRLGIKKPDWGFWSKVKHGYIKLPDNS